MGQIGRDKAVIICCDCDKVIGVWFNAQEKQEILYDCFCIDCNNKVNDEQK